MEDNTISTFVSSDGLVLLAPNDETGTQQAPTISFTVTEAGNLAWFVTDIQNGENS